MKIYSVIKIKHIGILLLSAVFYFSFFAAAQGVEGVPKILNHQGRLLDAAGNLLGGAGTNFCFRFSIYDDAAVGLGTKLWPAGTPSTMTVNVKNGVFNVGIGNTSTGGDALGFNFQDNDTVFLNTEVAAQSGGSCVGVTFENLSPRQRIVSSGYTINSDTVDGFHAAQSASGNQIPVLTSGNLILGGINPQISASSTNALLLQGGASGDIQFFSGANKITSSGSLTLAGAINASVLNIISPTATSTFSTGGLTIGLNQFVVQQTSGNIGIGISTPKEKLHLADGNFLQDGPSNPKVIGGQNLSLPGGGLQWVYVSGRYAYMIFNNAAGTDILRIIDVTDPTNPTIVGGSSLSLPGSPRSIYVSGRYAYVAFRNTTGTDIFRIIDISNPANPSVVGGTALSLPANGQHIFVSGHYAYLTFDNGAGTDTFRIIDVSNPTNPAVVGGAALSLPTSPRQIYASGRYAYVVFNNTVATDALRVIDISDPTNPTVVGGAALSLGFSKWSIYVSGRYAYVGHDNAAGTDIFRIVDISNPANPAVVGGSSLSLPGFAKSISVNGRYAYVTFDNAAGSNGFRIIDVSVPSAPAVVGGTNLSLPGFPKSVFVNGRYAYIVFFQGAGTDTFRIVDVSGIEAVSALLHSLEAGSLQVTANAQIQNQLSVGGGINIDGGGFFSRGGLGIVGNSTFSPGLEGNSATAFRIFNQNGLETLFRADTVQNLIKVGDDDPAANPTTLLVLDTKADAGDPAGTGGAMYYNSNINKFRCFENAVWKDCDATFRGYSLLRDAVGVTMTNAAAVGTEITNLVSRREINLMGMTNVRAQFAHSLNSAIIKLRIDFSTDNCATWNATPLVAAFGAAVGANNNQTSAFAAIPPVAITNICVRAVIIGDGVLDPIVRHVDIDVN